MKITDDDGNELPWDGKTFGRLKVRGPGYPAPISAATAPSSSTPTAGSTPATSPHIDPHGYMQITDRSKDVIKSGGEWISRSSSKTSRSAIPMWRKPR
jgi:fatty-acyl-CoA synthase